MTQKAVASHDTVVSYLLKQSSELITIHTTADERKTVSIHDSVPVNCFQSPQRLTSEYIRSKVRLMSAHHL